MYKVFFYDRTVFLTDDFISNFRIRDGLFYKYTNNTELKELIELFSNCKIINTLTIFHHDIEVLRKNFKSSFTRVDAAGGFVRNYKKEILLIKRRGFWDLPKGKLDHKESFQQAALREVQEECGIQELKIAQPLLSTYHTYHVVKQLILKKTYWFEMIYSGKSDPVPQTSEDITVIRWCKPKEIELLADYMHKSILDVFRYMNIIPL